MEVIRLIDANKLKNYLKKEVVDYGYSAEHKSLSELLKMIKVKEK